MSESDLMEQCVPLNHEDIAFARQVFRIRMTALVLDARISAEARGITDAVAAERLGVSIARLREMYLDPLPGTEWHTIPDMALALGCELSFRIHTFQDLPPPPRAGEA